ncbi:MAG TPA: hypothetical protein ACFCUC_05375 [Desulfobacterales bacterium]
MHFIRLLTLLLLATLAAAATAHGLDAEDLLRLKSAGIEDATLQALIEEKSLETAAVSVEEIIDLKKAGISEETLRLWIRKGSLLQDRQPVVYGDALETIQLTTISDLIRLKDAGFSDEVLQALLQVLGARTDADVDRAWEMLDHLGIRIDTRGRP